MYRQQQNLNSDIKQLFLVMIVNQTSNLSQIYSNYLNLMKENKIWFLALLIILTFLAQKCFMIGISEVIKSMSDTRIYKGIKLENELQCLIIYDKTVNISSASLSIGVGSFQDPIQAQGLSHLLLHMLLSGSKKFSKQNEFSDFVGKNSGSFDGFASDDFSSLFFQISTNQFKPALQRFSYLFTDPIFSETRLQNCINIIQSLFRSKLHSDFVQKWYFNKFIAKQNHPYRKLTPGNRQTLSKPNILQLLKSHFAAKYSSNIMKLVVYTNLQISEIQVYIKEYFSKIQNKNLEMYKIQQSFYSETTFKKLYKILSMQQMNSIQFHWILDYDKNQFQNPPSAYLEHILNNQLPGSLSSFLIQNNYAIKLIAKSYEQFSFLQRFVLYIQLTPKGMTQKHKIISYVLYFMKIIKQFKSEQWVFDEIKSIRKMNFDYLDMKSGAKFTATISNFLLNQKMENIRIRNFLMSYWKPDKIKQYLSQFKMENMFIFFSDKNIQKECDLQQPIFKIKYGIQNIQNIGQLQFSYSFPSKNQFLPKDFTIFPLGLQQLPSMIEQSEQFRVFYKKDSLFSNPKVVLKMRIYFLGNNTANQNLNRNCFIQLLNLKTRSLIFLGTKAGIKTNLQYQNYFTLFVEFSGFRDSVLRFITPYLNLLMSFQPDNIQFFNSAKQYAKKYYKNKQIENSYLLALEYLSHSLTKEEVVTTSQLQAQIQNQRFEQVVEFSKNWKKNLFVQCFMIGNVEIENAKIVINTIKSQITSNSQALGPQQMRKIPAIKISQNSISIVEVVSNWQHRQNSAIIVYFQLALQNSRSRVLQDLCYNFISQNAFTYLRYERQLGFIVVTEKYENRGVLGMYIMIQSQNYNPNQLSKQIDNFFKDVASPKLNSLTIQGFNQYKQSLDASRHQQYKNLKQQADTLWVEIIKHRHMYQKNFMQLNQIDSLTLQQFQKFYNSTFLEGYRRLQIHLIAKKHLQSNQATRNKRLSQNQGIKVYKSPDQFRKQVQSYPDFYVHQ